MVAPPVVCGVIVSALCACCWCLHSFWILCCCGVRRIWRIERVCRSRILCGRIAGISCIVRCYSFLLGEGLFVLFCSVGQLFCILLEAKSFRIVLFNYQIELIYATECLLFSVILIVVTGPFGVDQNWTRSLASLVYGVTLEVRLRLGPYPR